MFEALHLHIASNIHVHIRQLAAATVMEELLLQPLLLNEYLIYEAAQSKVLSRVAL